MSDNAKSAAAAALLAWYRDMGVDHFVGEAPLDWLGRGDIAPGSTFRLAGAASPAPATPAKVAATQRRPAAEAAAPRPASAPAARRFPTAAPDDAVMAARSAAGQAGSLDELQATLAGFDGCGLKATAKNLCFYRGAARARLILI